MLTAAHCKSDDPRTDVITGMVDVQDPHAVHRRVVASERASDGQDWMILKLDRPVSLPTLRLNTDARYDHGLFTDLGWGATQGKEPYTQSRYLMTANLPQVSDEECRQAAPGFDPTHELCAGYPKTGGPSGCAGDSGGPLVQKDDRDRWVQVGITSWGAGPGSTMCGQRGDVSGFVRVSAEVGLIDQAVQHLGG